MLSYFIFDNPIKSQFMKKNTHIIYQIDQLWKYGISGDLPIILIKIRDVNDGYVIREVLKAYEFFRTKNIQTEVVILDEEKHSYENYVREEIENSILNSQMSYLKNIKGGIFTLTKGEIDKKDIALLETVSDIIIDTAKGGLENNIKDLEEEYLEKYKQIGNEEETIIPVPKETEDINVLKDSDKCKYYNEYGAWIVFAAGITPFPYKVITIASGVVAMNLVTFGVASVVARGLRFFMVAGLLYFFGESIKKFIEKHFNLLSILFFILLFGGFLLIKYL